MIRKKAIFLDRDGVINVDKKYLYKKEECEFISGVFELCKSAIEMNFIIVVVTNQAGVARGYYNENDVNELHSYMNDEFNKRECSIKGFYFCPHHPEITGECVCRKPEAGLLIKAANDLNIDLSQSYMIGDKLSDAYAGKNGGVKESLLIRGDYDVENDEFIVFNSLNEIKKYIESRRTNE